MEKEMGRNLKEEMIIWKESKNSRRNKHFFKALQRNGLFKRVIKVYFNSFSSSMKQEKHC